MIKLGPFCEGDKCEQTPFASSLSYHEPGYGRNNKYAYCPVKVSRTVGPRIVDRAINNLSNDSEMWALQYAPKNSSLSLVVHEISNCHVTQRHVLIGPQTSWAISEYV